MKIKNIVIDGYRLFKNDSVRLETETTVLAGANNSGKTSFIDLLATVFDSSKRFTAEDYNAVQRFGWSRQVLEVIRSNSEQEVANFLLSPPDTFHPPRIEVRFEVAYEPETDDIREFADYLMDFDQDTNSFYFCFCLEAIPSNLLKDIEDIRLDLNREMLSLDWAYPLTADNINTAAFRSFQHQIDNILLKNSKRTAYFCNKSFETCIPMELKDFTGLFHFRSVKAGRKLDDGAEDKSRQLSRRLVEVAKTQEEWNKATKNLPRELAHAINQTEIHKITEESALDGLNSVFESIAKTNGKAVQDLYLDFILADDDINRLISRAMKTQYRSEDAALGESSQGLGYSNLIYLHLETESFVSEVRSDQGPVRVNLLAIEEPESHMHPQMQNAFINHLFKKVEETDHMQALVTTHSNEMVRSSSIHALRTLKRKANSTNFVDLKKFHEDNVAGRGSEKRRLFEFLYQINFADVLFADKVVLYEGDTERMYIQALIDKHQDLEPLRTQYVSYVQVGGAYAHIYKPLITDTLGIKSLIITDIDYQRKNEGSKLEIPDSILDRATTNATLNAFFKVPASDSSEEKDPTIQQLYSVVDQNYGVAVPHGEDLLGVTFQTAHERFARTFEEAILSKIYKRDVLEKHSRACWKAKRKTTGLKFTIPEEPELLTIADLVKATESKKTDFTYSLLLHEGFEELAPNYILNALKWLAQ